MKNLFIKLVICTIGFVNLNCEPAIEPVRVFTIQKGEHYSSEKSIETLQNSSLSFQAKFNASAIYNLGDVSLQSNKNKLMGFSDCNSLHHENSARFAWQWFNNRLEIFAYCYVNTERVEKYVGTVPLDQYSSYKIEILPTEYVFHLNDKAPVTIQRGNTCDRGVYYMLWPYFGGSVPAPHKVTIEIMQK